MGNKSNKIGKTVQTLRNWGNKGTLMPHHITADGTRVSRRFNSNSYCV